MLSSNNTYSVFCKNCNIKIGKHRNFCSRSCSATFNNKGRKHSEETKEKISKKISEKTKPYKRKNKKTKKSDHTINVKKIDPIKEAKKENIPYSKLCICKCKVCEKIFVSKTQLQFCIDHREHSSNMRMFYSFKFNVYDFPKIFDLDELNKIGWYAPKGKSGKWNPNGLSRDHKVSISESIKNSYDRFYITHPLNCDLIPHKENNKKKQKSSISYEELKSIVDNYEKSITASELSQQEQERM